MAHEIRGRNRWSDGALTKVSVRRYRDEDPVLVIFGGCIEERRDAHSGTFVLEAKHPTARDEEGDSSYAVHIEGAGLVFQGMGLGSRVHFTGALLKARFYTEEPAADAETLSFMPPVQKGWKPGAFHIEVEFLTNTTNN